MTYAHPGYPHSSAEYHITGTVNGKFTIWRAYGKDRAEAIRNAKFKFSGRVKVNSAVRCPKKGTT